MRLVQRGELGRELELELQGVDPLGLGDHEPAGRQLDLARERLVRFAQPVALRLSVRPAQKQPGQWSMSPRLGVPVYPVVAATVEIDGDRACSAAHREQRRAVVAPPCRGRALWRFGACAAQASRGERCGRSRGHPGEAVFGMRAAHRRSNALEVLSCREGSAC